MRLLAEGSAAMGARAWREFWKARGMRELRLLVWAMWDPIGCGVPIDEYDGYLFRIASLLGSRASEQALADELARIRRDEIGLPPDEGADARAAQKIALWFASVSA